MLPFVTKIFFSGVIRTLPFLFLPYVASNPADALNLFPFHVANAPALIFSFCSLMTERFSPSFITTPCVPSNVISPVAPILLPIDIIWSPVTVTVPACEFIILPTFFILSVPVVFLFFSIPANTPFLFPLILNFFEVCSSYLLFISSPGSISTPCFPLRSTLPYDWTSAPSTLSFPSESSVIPASPYSWVCLYLSILLFT